MFFLVFDVVIFVVVTFSLESNYAKKCIPEAKIRLALNPRSLLLCGGRVCVCKLICQLRGKRLRTPARDHKLPLLIFKIKNAFTKAKCSNFYTNEGNTVLGKIDFF
jgi:hypothetical protein